MGYNPLMDAADSVDKNSTYHRVVLAAINDIECSCDFIENFLIYPEESERVDNKKLYVECSFDNVTLEMSIGKVTSPSFNWDVSSILNYIMTKDSYWSYEELLYIVSRLIAFKTSKLMYRPSDFNIGFNKLKVAQFFIDSNKDKILYSENNIHLCDFGVKSYEDVPLITVLENRKGYYRFYRNVLLDDVTSIERNKTKEEKEILARLPF